MEWVWLGAFVFFLIVEALTVALISAWPALGSLAALIAAALGAEVWLQLVVFVIVTGVLLAFTRPFFKNHLKIRDVKTNFDRILGEIGIVTETIDNLNDRGLVKVSGQIWTARADNGSIIEQNNRVKILKITGVKAIVEKV